MNIEFLNLLKSPQEGDQSRRKKNREDEPIQVIIHMYMEMSHGNSLYSNLNKTVIFFLQDQRTGEQNRSCQSDWYQWEGGGCGEGV
jgi:hypothetical protein